MLKLSGLKHSIIMALLFFCCFAMLSLLASFGLARIVRHYGILVSPKVLTWFSLLGLMVALGMNYLPPWHRYFFRFFAATPRLSLSRDVLGLSDTKVDYVCHTVNGYRAVFSIKLTHAEVNDCHTFIRSALAPLFNRQIAFAVLLYEAPAARLQYDLDRDIEGALSALLAAENRRLAALPAKGAVSLIAVAEVPDPATAEAILAEVGPGFFTPFPWRQVAAGFFPPGLFDQPGAIAPSRAWHVPAYVENAAGCFLPLMLDTVRDGYAAVMGHTRLQELAHYLDCPVLWHYAYQPCPSGEVRRLRTLTNVQRFYPPGLLDIRTRREREQATPLLEDLEMALQSPEKPGFLAQVCWVALGDRDHRVIFNRASEFLARRHIGVRGAVPTTALSLYLATHPGGECAAGGILRPQLARRDEILAELGALGNWTGHAAPTVVLEDLEGKAFPLSLFGDGVNFNMALVGESGSGKSVFLAGLVTGHLAQSRFNRVIIVDYGGSFDGLVHALDGRQISHDDMRTLRFSPIPAFAPRLSELEFANRFDGQDYEEYLAGHGLLQVELMKQSLALLSYVCRHAFEDNAIFRDCYLTFLRNVAAPGKTLETAIEEGMAFARKKAEPSTGITKTAWRDLENFLTELKASVSISPYMGNDQVDLHKERLVSFNLDGFADDDRQTLVGLITLLINRKFAEPSTGRTLILFDEAHAYLKGTDKITVALGKLLESAQRVTRKHGASLLIATQSPADFEGHPALLENANHHCIMRLAAGRLPPGWSITRPEILRHAREAEPAKSAGFSQLHLATGTAHGTLQKVLRYRLQPAAFYLYTSEKLAKLLLRFACHISGQANFAALGNALHSTGEALIPIGSARFWAAIQPLVRPAYAALADRLPALLAKADQSPLLDLFLNDAPAFEKAARDPRRLADLECPA